MPIAPKAWKGLSTNIFTMDFDVRKATETHIQTQTNFTFTQNKYNNFVVTKATYTQTQTNCT